MEHPSNSIRDPLTGMYQYPRITHNPYWWVSLTHRQW